MLPSDDFDAILEPVSWSNLIFLKIGPSEVRALHLGVAGGVF